MKSRKRVVRHIITIRPDKLGRCDDIWVEQRLIKEFFLFGFVVWTKLLDKEIVPNYVWISSATIGDSLGWISKFAPFDKNGILLN